jgi:hypothetical protein
MKYPHLVNAITAAILILVGLYSFSSNPNHPPTALIGPAVGVLLLILTPGVKSNNRVVAHVVVGLTFLFGLLSLFFWVKGLANGGDTGRNVDINSLAEAQRRGFVFFTMAISCFIAVAFYVAGFIAKRKERLQNQAGH